MHVHPAALADDEITVLDGTAVTTAARTIVDLARTLPFEQALVPADAALRRHLVTREDLVAALERTRGRRGDPQARRALAFADPGAESPGETRSRVAIHHARLPPPVIQFPVRTARGRGERVDFAWVGAGVVGEFDGKVKYGRCLGQGADPGEVVYREKLREDAIRDAGWRVVRWTWADLSPFAPTAARLTRALEAG